MTGMLCCCRNSWVFFTLWAGARSWWKIHLSFLSGKRIFRDSMRWVSKTSIQTAALTIVPGVMKHKCPTPRAQTHPQTSWEVGWMLDGSLQAEQVVSPLTAAKLEDLCLQILRRTCSHRRTPHFPPVFLTPFRVRSGELQPLPLLWLSSLVSWLLQWPGQCSGDSGLVAPQQIHSTFLVQTGNSEKPDAFR